MQAITTSTSETMVEIKIWEVLDMVNDVSVHRRFRIKMDAPMGKVFDLFAERFKFPAKALRFERKNKVEIQRSDTPRILGLSTGESIVAILQYSDPIIITRPNPKTKANQDQVVIVID
jgi:hypothetical protein